MLYAYVRVSTDSQSIENQKFAIESYCENNSFTINKWVTEVVSGKTEYKKRKLGKLMKEVQKGDVIICSEISRLGRDMFMTMSIMNECVKKDVKIIGVKERFCLENSLSSRIFAMVYCMLSELEREFISQRTKEALARKKAEGVKLGRPKGSANEKKLHGKEENIKALRNTKISIAQIAKIFKVSNETVRRFLKTLN